MMTPKIEIDEGSGFCFGVVTAIRKAEEELAKGGVLYCLGDIVHNSREVERLKAMGLVTINHEEFNRLRGAKVLLRAHGEPPETYETARRNGIDIIDATCPVVLQLQKRIKQEYASEGEDGCKQIVIYGKNGHAEVLGLVGQTAGKAIVVENLEEVRKLDFGKDIRLYSQTTKRPSRSTAFAKTSTPSRGTSLRRQPSSITTPFAVRWPTAFPTYASLPQPMT